MLILEFKDCFNANKSVSAQTNCTFYWRSHSQTSSGRGWCWVLSDRVRDQTQRAHGSTANTHLLPIISIHKDLMDATGKGHYVSFCIVNISRISSKNIP